MDRPAARSLFIGAWRADPSLDEISRDGEVVKLEPRTMRLLMCLASRAGQVVSVQELLEHAWPDVVVGPDSVYQAIAALRRTLGDDARDPSYIANVPRRGYRLIAPVAPIDDAPGAAAATPPPGTATAATPPASAPQAPRRPGRWAPVALLAAAAVAIGLWLLAARPFGAAPTSGAGAAAPAAAAASEDSIAVLPFVYIGASKDQDYLADGIAEELLNLLAKVPRLRVISRSSAFSFKGQNLEIREVARRLNVAHVLEGSVRSAGTRVRITAQLDDARTGFQLWSETYDRPLDNILALQDEIAAAVVAQLKLKLLGGTLAARAADPKAYALVLQARQIGLQRTPAAYDQAIGLYRRALAIDAGYPAAWVGLARIYVNEASDGVRPIDESYGLASEAVQRALAGDSEYAPAYALLGRIAMTYTGDLATAARHYGHALTLEPQNTDLIRSVAVLSSALGRLDTSIALGEYVTARDPVNPAGYLNLGYDYFNAGRLDEAIACMRTVLRLSPAHALAEYGIGVALLLKGDAGAALAAMRRESSPYWQRIGLAMVYHALGRKADSDAALAELVRLDEKDAAYNIAYVHAFRGEADQTFAWLERAAAYHDPGLEDVTVDLLLRDLHRDPRWPAFLRRLGKAPEQLAAIRLDVQLPQ